MELISMDKRGRSSFYMYESKTVIADSLGCFYEK